MPDSTIKIAPDHTIKLARRCPLCGCHHEMEFPKKELDDGIAARERGALIQNAFPSFTPAQREFLKTGICSPCWEKVFG